MDKKGPQGPGGRDKDARWNQEFDKKKGGKVGTGAKGKGNV